MAGGSPIQAVLRARGVKGKKVSNLKRGSKEGVTSLIQSIITKKQEVKDPFYILDLGVVVDLFKKWSHHLEKVQPFYAIKCNPEPAFLGAMAALGSGFDCASRGEIESVLALGVSPDRIIYANPCKAESHIKYAANVGVNLTTFDSREEIDKIRRWHPQCELLIRLKAPDDGAARCPLGPKYGALPEEVVPLLQAANDARLAVVGVSFHVGSGVMRSQVFHGAIAAAKAVFNAAGQLGMPHMHILNIGGGFTAGAQFDEASGFINSALLQYFADEPSLKVIAEPGRFFAETAFTLATNIIGKRVREELREYWINDGIYGSMNCILYDHASVNALPLACSSDSDNPTCQGKKRYPSTVFGPTCDALDTVLTGHQLPELHVNDWLVFPNMGAYTASAGSNFNGFATSAICTYLAYSNPFQHE
ncbi:ornithine decarboxylase [Elaeis guineensis]|uniref:ornithine decarboxylase n=1 Tax=Elaeis guineensis var. tenera TaxID=51953 RepID=A0A6I9RZI1_ELAGV|nr:ornithine decarboxylase [Elaeis guineensis]